MDAGRIYVGVTDGNWFDFLRRRRLGFDEVNFWRPSGDTLRIERGTPFLFKLKAPLNEIAGGGSLTIRSR